jgi:hypothetical protein
MPHDERAAAVELHRLAQVAHTRGLRLFRLPRALLFVMSSEERKGSARVPHRAYIVYTGQEAVEMRRVGETAAPAAAPTTAEQTAILRQLGGLFVGRMPAPILTDVAPDDVALLCRVRELITQALGNACEP